LTRLALRPGSAPHAREDQVELLSTSLPGNVTVSALTRPVIIPTIACARADDVDDLFFAASVAYGTKIVDYKNCGRQVTGDRDTRVAWDSTEIPSPPQGAA
jgi:hypothetical protein